MDLKAKKITICLGLFLLINYCFGQNFQIKSPDKRISFSVTVDDSISWSLELDENTIINKAIIAVDFEEGKDYGVSSNLESYSIDQYNSIIYPVIPHKDHRIEDHYTELSLKFEDNFQLDFRAYNDGVAYRFSGNEALERTVKNEKLTIDFPEGTSSLFPKEESMYSHNERLYLNKTVSELIQKDFCSLPVLFTIGTTRLLLTESALSNYPGMFIKGNSNTSVDAIFPKYITKAVDDPRRPDRNQLLEKADYIAKVRGNKTYPWRIFIIADDDRTLVESNLTFQMAEELAIEKTDWIKPGKVAWDWYNANNIHGVDFKSGLNTASYKYYIDFAAKNKIEYVILDEGWTKSTIDILDFNPEIDVLELIRYGEEKGVGIILWVLWKPLDENPEEILKTYKKWGAKGVKVDFMQRNDQYMVYSYERIAQLCAKNKLLVNFHGSFKPSGLRRAYPNVINYEGVKGNENNKWSDIITPEHNVTIPFIRMAAGPMDFTPGSVINSHEKNFNISFERPMSLGTRAHQVAMYIVYEAPLQMLCDSPSNYYKEQETVDYIVRIPTTWDESKVLHASVGDYIVIARRKGENWYIGGMTDWTGREFEIDLSFMAPGNYNAEIFADGINADRYASDYKYEQFEVDSGSKLKAKLSSGGGWSAIITKID